jgi:hypothetical protein
MHRFLQKTMSPKREREMATLIHCFFATKPILPSLFARTVALYSKVQSPKQNIVEFAALRAVYCEHLHNQLAALQSIEFNRNKET